MIPAPDPVQLFDLGNALCARGDADAAVVAFRACLAAQPGHAATLFNLGNALVAAGRPVDAAETFVACLRSAPGFGPGYLNLARTLRGLVRLDDALGMAERAVELLPDEPEAAICLAAILHDRTDYAGSVRLYRALLARLPRHAGALSSLGNSLRALGHVSESLAAHDRAVAAEPDNAEYRFNRATALLAAGDYARGWDDYEWRWHRARGPNTPMGAPWAGEDITGRTILLHAEQGLGDTLQFARYVPMVAARGARVVLQVQPPLVRLMRTLAGSPQVIANGDPVPAHQVHCPLLSLPRAFATRVDSIPAQVPYLAAERNAVADWATRLPDDGRLRVGLVWAGSPHTNDAGAHLLDQRRSLPLGDLAPLGEIGGIHLVSLQKERPAGARTGPRMIDLMDAVGDFADTAALVANLDLVIAVDTSVAHLAAALGRPVWLLNRFNGCWRWLHGRDDSPWYPGLRIYRQARPLDWSGVVRRVRAELEAVATEAVPA